MHHTCIHAFIRIKDMCIIHTCIRVKLDHRYMHCTCIMCTRIMCTCIMQTCVQASRVPASYIHVSCIYALAIHASCIHVSWLQELRIRASWLRASCQGSKMMDIRIINTRIGVKDWVEHRTYMDHTHIPHDAHMHHTYMCHMFKYLHHVFMRHAYMETSPEFWQMSNMEYLQWGYGVCSYVLSIEYEHGIFVLGVGDMHHYHCWVGGQRCCQIYQGA